MLKITALNKSCFSLKQYSANLLLATSYCLWVEKLKIQHVERVKIKKKWQSSGNHPKLVPTVTPTCNMQEYVYKL